MSSRLILLWIAFSMIQSIFLRELWPSKKKKDQAIEACRFSPTKEIQKDAICWKVIASVLWDCEGVLKIDYLQKGQTITGAYYASNLRQLTLSQTTYFRLFQTERVCRRQFQIQWKWQKSLQMGRKQCEERRNCSLRAISPFPTAFSKDLSCRHLKTSACLGKS